MGERKEVDIFRETWLRYTAFASDFGEALRPFLSKNAYLGSYSIVAAYAVADTMDRGFKTYWQTRRGVLQASPAAAHTKALTRAHGRLPNKVFAAAPVPKIKHFDPVTATVADSLMWHGAASLALPYVVINRTVWATSKMLTLYPGLSPALHHALPTLAGLAIIPLIVPHIDEAVTHWMDRNVRPRLNLPPPVHTGAATAAVPEKQQQHKGTATKAPIPKPAAHL